MLFSTPGSGRFSRAPPFVKALGLHVHRSVPGSPSFVKLNTGAFLATTVSSLLIPGIDSSMILIWGSIAGILTLVGSWLLYNNAAQRKIGSILVLVFSVISLNFVGLILGLIGGFLGYTFKGASVTTSNTSGR